MDHTTKTELENHIKNEMPCCDEPKSIPEIPAGQPKKDRFLGACIVIAAIIVGGVWIYTSQLKNINPEIANAKTVAELEKTIIPERGVTLPIVWGDLGKQMIDNGVIDLQKFESLYSQRGGLDEASKNLLRGINNGRLVITKENSGVLLNLLWTLGLGNKNEILEKGEMTDKRYGGEADNFASTGGWSLAVGNPMNHYSKHSMIRLTPEQQSLVDEVSKNIYRPCCGNSTHFPDCNHGMAMLGLLELMASQGVSETDMYKAALAVNSYWFPDTYLTIAQYLKTKGMAWKDVSPKAILAAEYSSASGYQQILKQVQPVQRNSGGSCGA